MDVLKKLLTFEWMKGYRTLVIVGVVVGGYLAENFAGIDIPGLEFNLEMVLIALGLKTAADHSA